MALQLHLDRCEVSQILENKNKFSRFAQATAVHKLQGQRSTTLVEVQEPETDLGAPWQCELHREPVCVPAYDFARLSSDMSSFLAFLACRFQALPLQPRSLSSRAACTRTST